MPPEQETAQTASATGANGTAEVEYGEHYFRHDCGIPYERNEHWLGFFAKAADRIVSDLRPSSVLDAGCAMGFLVEALVARGVDAYGVDISEYAIGEVDASVADRCRVGSITEPFERRYDLITSIEVVEHLPPEQGQLAIENLCRSTDRVLLSTSPEDFGEATHLNVQPPEAWAAAMARQGFYRDLDTDFSYLTPWASLYVRREEDQVESVRRYDRAWSRQRREVIEVREALLRMQGEIEAIRSVEFEPDAETRAELDRRGQEILRLRDVLIGMEHELGVANGQKTQLEDRFRRLESAKKRVETTIPVFGKLLGRIARLLRLGR